MDYFGERTLEELEWELDFYNSILEQLESLNAEEKERKDYASSLARVMEDIDRINAKIVEAKEQAR